MKIFLLSFALLLVCTPIIRAQDPVVADGEDPAATEEVEPLVPVPVLFDEPGPVLFNIAEEPPAVEEVVDDPLVPVPVLFDEPVLFNTIAEEGDVPPEPLDEPPLPVLSNFSEEEPVPELNAEEVDAPVPELFDEPNNLEVDAPEPLPPLSQFGPNEGGLSCDNVLCEPDQPSCIETPEGPMCVAQISCANILCGPDTPICIETRDGPQCTPEGEVVDDILVDDPPPVLIECPIGMDYNECGSSCPETCGTLGELVICTFECVEGCFCPPGTVLQETTGACVDPTDCDTPSCPSDRVYNECGTNCPETCTNTGVPRICDTSCAQGCFCEEGTILDEVTNVCVPVEECSDNVVPVCEGGQEYTECGSACPTTCESLASDEIIACPAVCVPGCFCPRGMVLDQTTGECLSDGSECPDGPDVEPCGCACVRCGSPLPYCIETATGTQCVAEPEEPEDPCALVDCDVATPYCTVLSDGDVVCVADPPTDDECIGGKEFNDCGTACPLNCKNFEELIICTEQCVAGCFCPDGTVEDSNGRCIMPEECPEPPTDECIEPRVYDECGSSCPQSCETLGQLIPCTLQCVTGCFCPEGTVEQGNACVSPEACDDTPIEPPTLSCANQLCPVDLPSCIETPGGPECIELITCASVSCGPGSICIEFTSGASCVPEKTCEGATCPDFTACVETEEGPQCLPTPENLPIAVEGDGDGVRVDDSSLEESFADDKDFLELSSPSFPVGGGTCASATCFIGTPLCVETPAGPRCVLDCDQIDCPGDSICSLGANGYPECIQDTPPPRFTEFEWFNGILADFDSSGGNRLKLCGKRQDQQPSNGAGCAPRPKTCFFRTQLCDGVPTPMTECYCDGNQGSQTWSCTPVVCPQPPVSDGCPIPGDFGTCAEECNPTVDNSCPDGQICCSTGCGHTCTAPV